MKQIRCVFGMMHFYTASGLAHRLQRELIGL